MAIKSYPLKVVLGRAELSKVHSLSSFARSNASFISSMTCFSIVWDATSKTTWHQNGKKHADPCLVNNIRVPSWYGIVVLTLRICWTNRSSSVPTSTCRLCLARMRHDETINMFETTWAGFQVSPQHILDKIHFSKCDQCAFPLPFPAPGRGMPLLHRSPALS